MLTEREAVLFLERFAQLQRNSVAEAPCGALWESELLDLIHTICSSPQLTQVCLWASNAGHCNHKRKAKRVYSKSCMKLQDATHCKAMMLLLLAWLPGRS